MELKEQLIRELVKNGYSKNSKGRKVWNIANRSLLYIKPEQASSFLKVRSHPRYRKTIIDIEVELLKKNSEKFVKEIINGPFNLIDMGCGDGTKTKEFIKALGGNGDLRFVPVNSNKGLVELAMKNIQEMKLKNVKDFHPYVSDLNSLHEITGIVRSGEYQKNVILLLGSILASFEIHDYLFNLSRAMFQGDRLIIGNGIRSGERLSNLETYKHPLFKEWLGHTVKELGFRDDEIDYDARFTDGRVEAVYSVKRGKKVSHADLEVEFSEGDEIIAAALYKYYDHELEKVCKRYFGEVQLVKDSENEYALILCVK
jgi:uncharacterized SAM-dependent methyltransferase